MRSVKARFLTRSWTGPRLHSSSSQTRGSPAQSSSMWEGNSKDIKMFKIYFFKQVKSFGSWSLFDSFHWWWLHLKQSKCITSPKFLAESRIQWNFPWQSWIFADTRCAGTRLTSSPPPAWADCATVSHTEVRQTFLNICYNNNNLLILFNQQF